SAAAASRPDASRGRARLAVIRVHSNRMRLMRIATGALAVGAASLPVAVAQEHPVRVLVSYYSQAGNTEKLAAAIGKGAASVKGVEVAVKKTADVKDAEILQADGILLGTPVQWSNAATGAKQFLDRVGDVLWKAKANGDGKTAGAFCTGGG